MKLYLLKEKQFLPISLSEAWDFFSNPRNLAKITPESMGFEILSDLPERMREGMIIEYFIRPLPGIKMRWVTEITHTDEPEFFIDEQRFGPYRFWHHQHLFEKTEGGIIMTDLVHYALPYGVFGRLAHSIFVKNQLNKIFRFRKKVLAEKFF